MRSHHGSVSREQRTDIEERLKNGALRGVVATSTLELGIDMAAVDLVVLVESPPSVASGLQRVGRAGHQVGATSVAKVFPKHRGDLLEAAVVVDRMYKGAIEATRIPQSPLDVLAQQIVAIAADRNDWRVDTLYGLVRRASPYSPIWARAGVRGGARHARWALPVRRVRRTAAPDRVGSGRRDRLRLAATPASLR